MCPYCLSRNVRFTELDYSERETGYRDAGVCGRCLDCGAVAEEEEFREVVSANSL